MRLTWVGHSTVLLDVDGLRLLTDPLLRRGAGPLRRVAPVPDQARRFLRRPDRVDAVLLSHLHHDHCDLRSLRALDAPIVLVPPGAGRWLTAQGVARVVELRPGQTTALSSRVSVTAVEAVHSGRREPRGPTATAVGHLVSSTTTTAWLAGDTGSFGGMAELPALSPHGVLHLAAVPVWGWGPTLGPGHLDPRTAAEAVVTARVGLAVPVHWGTLFPLGTRLLMRRHLTEPGPEFARHVEELTGEGSRVRVLPVGGSVDVVPSG